MKKAFTLAELLIVIVIVGFIATLTIMTLVKSTPNQQHMLFRKTYYEMSNAISLVVNDSFYYPGTDRSRPVLAAPVTNMTAIRARHNLSAVPDNNSILCVAMAKLVGDIQGAGLCLNVSGNPGCSGGRNDAEPVPNFVLSNGTKVFGLCGDFQGANNRHRVYLYTQASKADRNGGEITPQNVVQRYDADRPVDKDPLEWNTHLYRVWLDANGKIYPDSADRLENLLLKDRKIR